MATVNTEGKGEWVLMSEYGYITTKEYIKLGTSLGTIQALSSLRKMKLAWWSAKQKVLSRNPSWNTVSDHYNNNNNNNNKDDDHNENTNCNTYNTIHELLYPLLSDIVSIADITHGQSMSLTILKRFRKQAERVRNTPREHQVVFEMAATDAAITGMKLREAPLNITYEEAIVLTSLISEALAWEWHWLTYADNQNNNNNSSNNNMAYEGKQSSGTRPHTLAMMLDNSPEFNLIWMAVSEASVWMTFLDALYGGERPNVNYHHCSTALLNTNLANHHMLSHGLECVKAEILVLEEKFIPLLFEKEEVEINNREKGGEIMKRRIVLPSCVKRIFVWRGTPAKALKSVSGVESWMLEEVRHFNQQQESNIKSNNIHIHNNNNSSSSSSNNYCYYENPGMSGAILDLFDLVRCYYPPREEKEKKGKQKEEEEEEESLFPILTEHILRFPPNVTIVSKESKFKLQQRISSLLENMKKALLQFRPVMPILHIYTSGTTGLPKAARFSHLRFFAAFFLASVLPQRQKTWEILSKNNTRNGKNEVNESGFWTRLKNMFFNPYPSFRDELSVLTVYNCLPMYHTVGCVFCMGHLLRALEEQQNVLASVSDYKRSLNEEEEKEKEKKNSLPSRLEPLNNENRKCLAPTARMIIRTKFSASRFVRDLQYYRVTVFQYIGEIIRYALHYEMKQKKILNIVGNDVSNNCVNETGDGKSNCNEKSSTTNHSQGNMWIVPFAFGNGLRSDIWHESKAYLHIAQIVEFYSSTEGNIFLINLFDLPGVSGHLPLFPSPIYRLSTQFNPLLPFRVVRYDFDSGEVWRDPATGRCAYCGVGETGEVVGEIIRGFDIFGLRRFDGYHSAVETRRNIIRDVFTAGDAYFRSGDLVRFDEMGFVTFVDRVGETYRWKGENVSTTEVMNTINRAAGTQVAVQEAVVYGVCIPKREGRAGMAKLTLTQERPKSLNLNVMKDHNNNNKKKKKEKEKEVEIDALYVSQTEERLFLQNELYGLLTGKEGDGSTALPSYAIPVCIRVDDQDQDGETNTLNMHKQQQQQLHYIENDKEEKTSRSKTKNHTGDAEHTTTTFKYRRHVLVKEGYQYAFSGNNAYQSRVYVLVTKKELLEVAGIKPIPDSVKCGYVPLNTETVSFLGEELQNCGW
ncbi:fatty acid transporter protein-like [Trypanosoma theileri]|uniref:Fatty acid transporter protein-like n=1 Tax=Trypanosoma theileri TaxID=67003 RepID=A0A1X0NVX4_9TRYP|nr:fatty acid transporter protein-like [Trypanosoma theileri]ORC88822.1 fatty acid transporter protein-like [Trypanosoma theileri]